MKRKPSITAAPKRSTSEPISLQISQPLLFKLVSHAKEKGVSVEQIITISLERYLNSQARGIYNPMMEEIGLFDEATVALLQVAGIS